MLKTKARTRRIFTARKRVRRRFSWLGAIASVGLLLLSLELITRIFLDLTNNRTELAQAELAQAESEQLSSYQLEFLPQGSTKNASSALLARPSMAVGYSLVKEQNHQFWQINQQGFRDEQPVPIAKPKDEIRIFLLGSSTAFGYGNANNSATISSWLEQRLHQRLQQQQQSPQLYQPDLLPADPTEKQKYSAKSPKLKAGNYRVINAAVPGYASGNQLAQVALQILPYKPDLILVMDGYNDLMLPSTQDATQAPGAGNSAFAWSQGLGRKVQKTIEPWLTQSYFAQAMAQNWESALSGSAKTDFLLEEKPSQLVKRLPQDEAELQARVAQYIEHHQQILNLCAAAKVPLVVALQPEITGRNPSQLTDSEGQIAKELGRTYIKQVRDSYPQFIQAAQKLAKAYPSNLKVVDLYKLTDQYPTPSFVDAIHLNEAANQKVAEQLYYAVSGLSKMQVVPTQAKPDLAPPSFVN